MWWSGYQTVKAPPPSRRRSQTRRSTASSSLTAAATASLVKPQKKPEVVDNSLPVSPVAEPSPPPTPPVPRTPPLEEVSEPPPPVLRATKSSKHAAMVAQRLFLGDKIAAHDKQWLLENGITAIVNCTLNASAFPEDFEYLHIALEDCDSAPIHAYFQEVSEFIEKQLDSPARPSSISAEAVARGSWWAAGPCVLLHCQAGRSRSAALVLAHLLNSAVGTTLEALFARVTSTRPIYPNPGFVAALRTHASSLGVPERSDELPGSWPPLQPCDGASPEAAASAVQTNIRRWKARLDTLNFCAPDLWSCAAELRYSGATVACTAAQAFLTVPG
eukprot:TRINITY_DN37942_c0_g1_i3.p1 TRINITY_DN37942_c0_g1~~TRINITY_DN37942_c0_g1_i3.p1  ORF type:complete len:331 (-),score=50.51 TRINITY_DN37942_c0_g1_i3:517-1509(-)